MQDSLAHRWHAERLAEDVNRFLSTSGPVINHCCTDPSLSRAAAAAAVLNAL